MANHQNQELIEVFAQTLQHYFPHLSRWIEKIHDPRAQYRIIYHLNILIISGILLFLIKAQSRRQLKYLFTTSAFIHNLNLIAGKKASCIAHHDTVHYSMKRINPEGLEKVRLKMINRLIRMKALQKFRLLNQFYMIVIDMTGHLVFRHKHCKRCLWKKKEGKILYWYHPVVEAKLITENGLALSIETEFAENTGKVTDVQDCELKAMYRLIARLKKNFPQLQICLVLDGLYANGTVLEMVKQYQWQCIITFKEGSMPDVWNNAQGLKQLQKRNSGQCMYKGKLQRCQWVNGVEYQGKNLAIIEDIEEKADGTFKRFVWLTTIEINKHNYVEIVKGGRSRWTIENQGFNMQKNGGYNLEHAYSTHPVGLKNFYLLMQIAHIINQLMEKGNLLKGKIASAIGSIKNIATYLLEELRTKKIDPTFFFSLPKISFQIRLDTS